MGLGGSVPATASPMMPRQLRLMQRGVDPLLHVLGQAE
jgi:hypothetical protein